MAKLITLFSLMFFILIANAQVTIVSGGNSTACGGTFTAGNVAAGQTYTKTICADETGNSHIKVSFDSCDVDVNNELYVYDGPDKTYPLIGVYNNDNFGASQALTATLGNLSGCLTFVLTSVNGFASWNANISCNFSCQPFYSKFLSSNPATVDNYIDVCQGENITFNGAGDYYVNDTLYHQQNTTSTFVWDFGDGKTATGETVNHSYSKSGGHSVNLTITDQFGCVNSNFLGNKVRVSTTPNFVQTEADFSTTCLGESINLIGNVNATKWTYEAVTKVSGITFLPDGDGDSYSSSLMFDAFNEGQTLNNINDLESISANLEHSYLDDLVISIVCPNGNQVVLENQGGFVAVLGQPVDDDLSTLPGIGYDYSWTSNPTYGVMSVEAEFYSPLPAGSYASYQPLSNLVGCPLNGLWKIVVTDNFPSDNGFIFSWGINLKSSLYPPLWNFTPSFQETNYSWTGNNLNQQADATVSVTPASSGDQNYTFEVTDNFGCKYDTTISVTVLAENHPDCCNMSNVEAGNNTEVFGKTYHLLATPANSPSTYTWTVKAPQTAVFSSSDSTGTQVTVSNYGTYTFIFTETNVDCSTSDEVQVIFQKPPCTLLVPNAGTNTEVFGKTSHLLANPANTLTSYKWTATGPGISTFANADSSGSQITVSQYGTYTFTFTESNEECEISDEVQITFQKPPCNLLTPDAGTDSEIYGTSSHLLAIPANDLTSFQWTASGPGISLFSDSDSSGTQVSVTKYGLYTYTFTETKDEECFTTDVVQILFKEIPDTILPIFIPNTFTPNGDGINDTWIIDGIDNEESVKIFVYNRYGARVFHSEGIYEPWDGKFNDIVLPTASYYFVIEIRDEKFKDVLNIVGPK